MSNVFGLAYRYIGAKYLYPFALSRISYWLYRVFIVRGRKAIAFRTKYGFLMELSPYEYYMSGYFFLGETNPMETRTLRNVLKKGDTFLDVGAHVGWYSLNARQMVGSEGKVIAFEPNPRCASITHNNISLNFYDSIKLKATALSDKKGVCSFWIGDDMAGSLIKKSAQELTHDSVKKIKVNGTTLDAYCRENAIKDIRLIKIDVEGSEAQVIKGAAWVIKKYRPNLILEVYSNTLKSHRERLKMIRQLMKLGYRLFVFTSDGIAPVLIHNLPKHIINVFMSAEDI